MAKGLQQAQIAADTLRPFGFKNLIINGAHNFWQRGTSFACSGATSTSLTADRFKAAWNLAAGAFTVSQETSILPDATVGNCLKVACTTIRTMAAGEFVYVNQLVEGYNIRAVSQSKVTLSFWVRSNKTGIYCLGFLNSGVDRAWVAEYTINSANVWEKKIVTIDLSVGTASGTWDYASGTGLHVRFALAVGATYQTTKDTWQNAQYFGTSSQVNFMDTNTNVIYISEVQLEKGDVATDFERRLYGQELALCQRYFEKSYDVTVNPGTVTDVGDDFIRMQGAQQTHEFMSRFAVVKRGSPVVTWYSPATGTAARIRDTTAAADRTISGSAYASQGCAGAALTAAGVGADGSTETGHWTADAEL